MQQIFYCFVALSIGQRSLLIKDERVVALSENSNHVWTSKYLPKDQVFVERIYELDHRDKPYIWQRRQTGIDADDYGYLTYVSSRVERLRVIDHERFLTRSSILTKPNRENYFHDLIPLLNGSLVATDGAVYYKGKLEALPAQVSIIPSEGKDLFAFDALTGRLYRFHEAAGLVRALADRFLTCHPYLITLQGRRLRMMACFDHGTRFYAINETTQERFFFSFSHPYQRTTFRDVLLSVRRVYQASWGYILVSDHDCLVFPNRRGTEPPRTSTLWNRLVFTHNFALTQDANTVGFIDSTGLHEIAEVDGLLSIVFGKDYRHANVAVAEGRSSRIYFDVPLNRLATLRRRSSRTR